MMQWWLERFNRYRCFYQIYSALWARILFITLTFLLMRFSDTLAPQTEYIFRGGANETLHGPRREVLDLAFRDDGNWLAGTSRDGNIYLWDFHHFENLSREDRQPIVLPLETGYANRVLFTRGGEYLISAGTDREIKIWLSNSLQENSLEKYSIYQENMSSTDPFLEYISLNHHSGNIQYLELSPNGRWLASGDQFGNVVLWDMALLPDETRMEEKAIEITSHNYPLTDIEFSRSEHHLAISDHAGVVSIHDLTLVENKEAFLASSHLLQEQGERIYDLSFANPQNGDLISAEQYLFGAGPDKSIIEFNLIDENQEPFIFPNVHEGIPYFLQTVYDPSTPEISTTYWLVSVDNQGIAVLWDLEQIIHQNGHPDEEDFYQFQLMNGEPTALSANLNPELYFHDTSRNLLAAGSKDFSVRIVNMGVEADDWNVVQLRNSGRSINDVEIRSDNTYIASAGKDRKVRIWDAALVSDFQNAVPWRTRFMFLVPILLIYMLAFHSAGFYIMRMYNLERVEVGVYYVLMSIFGLNFERVPLLLLSILFPIYPKAEIASGELIDENRHSFIQRIGGPARIAVRPGNVAAFESTRMQTNVVTNTTYCLRPFERMRHIINLGEQIHEELELTTYTRDGISVKLKNVRFRYRVRHHQYDVVLQEMRKKFAAAGKDDVRRKQLAEIFDKMTMKRFQDQRFMNALQLTTEQEKLIANALTIRNLNSLSGLTRTPNQWGSIDPEALISAVTNIYWAKAIIRPTLRRIRHFVNIRPIDYFTAPNRIEKGEPEDGEEKPNGWFRDEFRRTVIQQMQGILKAVGAEITWLDVGTFEISRSEVETARWNLWQWQLRRGGEAMRSSGRAQLEAARARGRIQGEARIVEEIINAMESWEQELDMNQALTDENRQAIVSSRLAMMLRRYLGEAQSDGTFPPPWMNPSNPNNPTKKNP